MDTKNKKNIAIIIPCLSKGGAERAAGLLSSFIADRYNIFLFLFDTNDITYDYKGKIVDLNFNQINKKYKKYEKLFLKLSAVFRYMELIGRIKKRKSELNIDCSISFLETPNLLNLLSRINEKIIVSVRSTRSLQTNTKMEKLENLFIKLLYNKANRVVAVSHGVKDDLIKSFGVTAEIVATIYNFFDFDRMKKMSKEDVEEYYDKYFKNNDIIINIGRLVDVKNQVGLIREFSIVKKTMQNAKLMIIGSGPLECRLKEEAQLLGLENDVIFISFTSNPFKYLSRAKIFVLNSVREGFGNVIIEAMACGVPVISTDCLSGPREIIADKFDYDQSVEKMGVYSKGILVPTLWSNNKTIKENRALANHELSKAIIMLLNDKDLRDKIGHQGKEFVLNNSIESLCQQWIEVIEN